MLPGLVEKFRDAKRSSNACADGDRPGIRHQGAQPSQTAACRCSSRADHACIRSPKINTALASDTYKPPSAPPILEPRPLRKFLRPMLSSRDLKKSSNAFLMGPK